MGKGPEQIFIQRHTNGHQVHEKVLNITNIGEMQIQTTMRYHLTPVWNTTIKKKRDRCSRGCEEKESLLHCWQDCKSLQPLGKTVWNFLKIENRTTIWSNNPNSMCISRGNKIHISKRYLHPHVHFSIIHNSPGLETT